MNERATPLSARRLMLIVVLGSAVLAGCASKPVDIVAKGDLKVNAKPTPVLELPLPSVVRRDDIFEVTGSVRRKPNINEAIPGHIDAVFLDKYGQEVTRLGIPWIPRQIPMNGNREASYSVNYGCIPSGGVTLQIEYDDGSICGTEPSSTSAGHGGSGGHGGGGAAATSGGSRPSTNTFRANSGGRSFHRR